MTAEAIKVPIADRRGRIRAYTLVSPEDASWVGALRWSLASGGYARCERGLLHRECLGLAAGDKREGDHINRDKLDNRRCNLRIVTRAENAQNLPAYGCSGVRGLSASRDYWNVKFTLNGEFHWVGAYRRFADAAKASYNWLAENAPHALDADDIPDPIIVGELPLAPSRRFDHPGPAPTLAADVAKRIRDRRIAGERGKDLAAEFGISQQLVCDILKGRRYVELEEGPRVPASEAIETARRAG